MRNKAAAFTKSEKITTHQNDQKNLNNFPFILTNSSDPYPISLVHLFALLVFPIFMDEFPLEFFVFSLAVFNQFHLQGLFTIRIFQPLCHILFQMMCLLNLP